MDSTQAAATWRPMESAPKDGSRILVVIRASEQGPSDVDVVRWARPPRNRADDCWISTDSRQYFRSNWYFRFGFCCCWAGLCRLDNV